MRGLMLLFVLLAWFAPLAAEEARGGFNVVEAEDGLHKFIFTNSVASDGPGRVREPALAWSCDDDGLNVFHVFGRYLAGDDNRSVRVRFAFGDHPYEDSFAAFERWMLAYSSRSAWMPLDAVRPFTREALANETVVLQAFDPLDEEILSDRFELHGLADALALLPCY